MAGIGFSLKRLFNKDGILSLCRAYGYAGVITTGPMVLGVLLLFGVSFVAKVGGMPAHDRELINAMLTYSLLASLTISSLFNMTVTRFISDCLYEEKESKIMPSFFGSTSIMLVITLISYGTFLHFSGVTLFQQILCLWFAMTLIVVWTEMIYMSALKDYKSIFLSFLTSVMIGFLLALVFILLGMATIESMFICVIVAYGTLAVRYLKLMYDYFPKSEGSYFSFLGAFDKYRQLAFSSILMNIGLFSHLVIMYFGPLKVQVQGLFYGAPQYDVPAFIAFFSLLITTIGFVASVEVKFYPQYSNYYGLFNDKGAIHDIKLAEREMRTVLSRELTYLGHKQVFTTIFFVVLVPQLLQEIMPGISALSLSIFRFLCVGYGTYALANSMMLILLYFEDYTGALVGTVLFAVLSTGATIWQILYGSKSFYGLGFFIGGIVFYAFVTIRLSWYTKRLPYFLLARQSIVPYKDRGLFILISSRLDERQEKIKKKYDEEINRRVRAKMKGAGL